MTDQIVTLENVAVRFGVYTALEAINFQLHAGDFLTLLGPNGAGKSTLIKTIMGLVEPSSGSVELFGQKPRDVDSQKYGYIPQIKSMDRDFPALPEELVISGITGRWPWFPSQKNRELARTALQRVGLSKKLDTPIGKLSGGELQRVYLARAFVRHPPLLILDEPATGLDAIGEADMYRLLESYRSETGAAIIMITHDWEVAHHHASKVLLLNRKQIAFGKPKESLSGDFLRRTFGHEGHHHPMAISITEHHHH